MEGEAIFRRGGMKYIRSRSFSGLFGGHPGISQGSRSRFGEAEDEEGQESMEEEKSDKNEVKSFLEYDPEAPEAPNLALSNQPFVSKAEPNLLKIMEKWLNSWDSSLNKLPQETLLEPHNLIPHP
ncbi:hypothetical protein O181_020910 [Austropuccinia psidii MF-1]|uniref:Uncharacterized protein n=1 Tax=Austropuccinia psidii MF-1 TaxID=1389203 RepID=A0A9Q3GWJ9_9BASI|nr:hypothetical protein [Austropuccinia psidii MF-1]